MEIEIPNAREALSVTELLGRTYKTLCERLGGWNVVLPRAATPIIVDNADWERAQTGHMRYERMRLVRFTNAWIALGNGIAWGGYLAEAYACDIIAVRMPAQQNTPNAEQVRRYVSEESHFSASPVFAFSDGRCAVGDHSRFRGDMRPVIHALSRYARSPAVADGTCAYAAGYPQTRYAQAYEAEAAIVLTNGVHDSLYASERGR